MALARLTFSFDGTIWADRVLMGLADRCRDFAPVFEQIADDLEQRITPELFRFRGRGAVVWPEYQKKEMRYVRWKKKKLGLSPKVSPKYIPILRWSTTGGQIPEANEILYPSLVEKGHPLHVRSVKPKEFKWGTAAEHAQGHHRGTGRAARWMGGYILPKRSLVALNEDDKRKWTKIAHVHVHAAGKIRPRPSDALHRPTP